MENVSFGLLLTYKPGSSDVALGLTTGVAFRALS